MTENSLPLLFKNFKVIILLCGNLQNLQLTDLMVDSILKERAYSFSRNLEKKVLFNGCPLMSFVVNQLPYVPNRLG